MYKFTNLFKSLLKKYLPDWAYYALYRIFKKIEYLFSDKNTLDKQELLLASFTQPVFKTVKIDNISFDIKLDPNNGLVDKEIYAKGSWEPEMLREIGHHINEESVCLDIGANIGQHSLFMAKIAQKGRVYAFDPITKLTTQIKESVEKNSLSNIEVLNFGLSNENKIIDIYLNNLNMGNTTFKKRLGASSVEKAETKIFDSFWESRGKIDFVKIDVEGYEYYCLLGMKESLRKYHPKIILEFTPLFYNKMGIKNEEIIELLFNLGYSLYDLEKNREELTRDNMQDFLKRVTIQTNLLCIYKQND